AFVFVGIASLSAQELTLTDEDMQYNAGMKSISVDGDVSDWSGLPVKKAIPFEQGGELVLFEEYGGGTWSGPEDHTSAVSFAWDADNLYVGVVVTDDTHQNPGDGWNGDSIQMVFANAAQDTVTHLYNYALSDGGDLVLHNERGPGGTELAVVRDDDNTTTSYEIKFPADSLGLDALELDMQIGIGVCVNDGDTDDGQAGQKGWSGWGPYAAVYGKTASATGLVTLTAKHDASQLVPGLIAYWPFDNASEIDGDQVVVDMVSGIEGVVNGETSSEEGHVGGAIDFGENPAGNWVSIEPDEGDSWLTPVSDANQLTVAFWQKNHSTPNTSSFWLGAASANNGQRNAQAHVPWGGATIYWDTAGCCGGDTRINAAWDGDWLEWNHYVFIKNEDLKQIYINGELFHEGENNAAFKDDWTVSGIGSNNSGGSNVAAILDEFGVWAR
ncbi:MAG: hypothetical protein NZ789_03170, partial [Pseudomonadales bacterium]|nr:hypothetical protein [Pseudomonadales bacterium]